MPDSSKCAVTPNVVSTACGPNRCDAIDDWLAPYRREWEQRLDDLERELEAMPDDEQEPS